jgi:Cadherin-like
MPASLKPRLTRTATAALLLGLLPMSSLAKLSVSVTDEGLNDLQWTKPRIRVQNTGTAPETFHAIRYAFPPVAGKIPQASIWDPGDAVATLSLKSAISASVEVELGAITLQPGESLRWGNGILLGIHNSDWSVWNKLDSAVATVVSGTSVPSVPVVPVVPPPSTPSVAGCWLDHALFAQNGLFAGDRTAIQGSVRSNTTLGLGHDLSLAGNAYSLAALTLDDRARVVGNLESAGAISLGYGATVTGAVTRQSGSIAPCNLPAPLATAIGSADIRIGDRTSQVLVPGAYGSLVVGNGATVRLQSGVYVFGSIEVLPDGALSLASGTDPVKLSLQGSFRLGDRARVTFEGTELPRRLDVYANGTQPSIIGHDAVFAGALTAPAAEVLLQSRSLVKGSVAANAVSAETDSRVEWFAPAVKPNLPPVFAGTLSFPCAYGWGHAIKASELLVQDADTPLDQLVFTLTSLPTNGIVVKEGAPMAIGSTFTLFDLTMLRISYEHTKAYTAADGFDIEVTDGTNHIAAHLSVNITAPVMVSSPEAPVVSGTLRILCAYGWSQAITPAELQATDSDTPVDQLVFSVKSLPTNGILTKEGMPLAVGSTFTAQDIALNRIAYDHTKASSAADGFDIEVTDGISKIPAHLAVTITAPVMK